MYSILLYDVHMWKLDQFTALMLITPLGHSRFCNIGFYKSDISFYRSAHLKYVTLHNCN